MSTTSTQPIDFYSQIPDNAIIQCQVVHSLTDASARSSKDQRKRVLKVVYEVRYEGGVWRKTVELRKGSSIPTPDNFSTWKSSFEEFFNK